MFIVALFVGLINSAGMENHPMPYPDVKKFFNETNYSNMAQNVAGFYAPQAVLIDPVGEHRGIESIQRYYENLYKNAKSVRFEFTDEVISGDQVVVMWKMYVQHPAIKGGEEITAFGNSHIRYSPELRKAIYHRDYFDLSEFVFDNIPVLGWMTRQIKARMKGNS